MKSPASRSQIPQPPPFDLSDPFHPYIHGPDDIIPRKYGNPKENLSKQQMIAVQAASNEEMRESMEEDDVTGQRECVDVVGLFRALDVT